jgi:hypothetical protein
MENKELKQVYIHETHTLWQEYGEVHLMNNTHHIVWNADSLFHDLDGLIMICFLARKVNEERLVNTMKMQIKKYEEAKNNTTTENS